MAQEPHARTAFTLTEVVLRLMVLKHVRNWSYGVLAREVRANLVYRQFTRLGHHRMPHAKTLGKLGLLLGPTVVQPLHQRVVAQAHAEKVMRGNKLRVDTTVVETNIHYPTDSVLERHASPRTTGREPDARPDHPRHHRLGGQDR